MKDQIEKAIDLVLEGQRDDFFKLLDQQNVNYIARPDGLVDVYGNVSLTDLSLTKIPIQFGVVTGYFNCTVNQLTSLEGSPQEVGGWFACAHNQLTSLIGCPEKIGGGFECSHNQLTSLKGCAEEIGGYFYCNNNQLTSLIEGPKKIDGTFDCSFNHLTSLRGCPEKIGGGLFCDGNPVEFTKEDIILAKQGKAPLGLPLSWVLMKKKEKELSFPHEKL